MVELTLVVIGVGIVLLGLARWARKMNESMGPESSRWKPPADGFISIRSFFFGSSSPIESQAGTILAWIVIAFVAAFLLFVAYGVFINL